MRLRHLTAFLCVLLAFAAEHAVAEAERVSFESEVVPLLEKRCNECHHPEQTGGGLDLTRLSTNVRSGKGNMNRNHFDRAIEPLGGVSLHNV